MDVVVRNCIGETVFHHFILFLVLLYLFFIMASCCPNRSFDFFMSVVLLSVVVAINQAEQDRHVSKQSQDASYRREVKPQKQVQR